MIVVADSTPIIALCRVGRLALLRQVFGRIVIPDAVWNEIVIDGQGRPGADEIQGQTWIERRSVTTNRMVVQALELTLDTGEAEAIALAQEIHADFLLMDEKLGRTAAERIGLTVTGLLGVLLQAKRLDLEPDPAALAEKLRANGVWLSNALIDLLRKG